ncbi:energy-coupling factor transporter ATPase [Carnobacteriaceae bacterium zg-ZUI78]|uniref:energy-coupling factor transporter ATPase n=1 Tax=Granulicatella sp. zg-84 TaxID=2678503 RepID=UPI0013C18B61|nr:energy-coupling factor transporter ATPase [Granulicatella sp. zg-84]MBS4749787.1 energy-coupling factor transporter ATPase [Carnobacteriaceae bacterium zg-ZUI78]NEW65666.1 energy-coupling factor transporter ATPase [Granulicatella sp. zg-84]QMI85693.1 energy-coupling factor transporter ATPase [Carnobacteriaceae bacterium zg-84]
MSITFEQVNYIYQPDTPFTYTGLQDISFSIEKGTYTAVIGQTGSGKSTLIQHLNALLKPTEGMVSIEQYTITNQTKEKNLKMLRKLVGIVFQFPESQLFEETVLKDVMFGPMNFGASQEEAEQKAKRALSMVGIDERFFTHSPFELSGGQMRRVAIAGILAIEPDILVLDEPTAGLDPRGALEMMTLFDTLHKEYGLTIVLVTHQMNDVALYADNVVVLKQGKIEKMDTPIRVFRDREWLKNQEIDTPQAMAFVQSLRHRGCDVEDVLTFSDLIDVLTKALGGRSC